MNTRKNENSLLHRFIVKARSNDPAKSSKSRNVLFVKGLTVSFIFTLSNLVVGQATADSLSDLKATLLSLNGSHDISAELIAEQSRKRDDEDTTTGYIELQLNESVSGFHVTYNKAMLALLDQEKLAKVTEQQTGVVTKKPTTIAMQRLQPIQLRNMLSKGKDLAHFIEQLTFLNEAPVELNGGKANLLTFDVAMETIVDDKRTRGHVDEFSGTYQMWLTPEGVPIQAKLDFLGEGSYYLFFSVEIKQTVTEKYQIIGNRLVTNQRNFYNKVNSTFGEHEYSESKALTVISANQNNNEIADNKRKLLGKELAENLEHWTKPKMAL